MPDELDPQIKEFTSQLRRLVDRSGLSIAALADRTGYSKTSWERYLGGRLLAPKGAIVALAEVTGTHPVHLTTMWELAERAWSRAEMRHDRTMEQIRISQARAALGEFGAAEAEAQGTGGTRTAHPGPGTAPIPGSAPIPGTASFPGTAPGAAASAGAPPRVPSQPTASDADERERADRPAPAVNSWGLAGYEGPSRASGRPGTRPVPLPEGAGRPAVPPQPYGGQRPPAPSAGGRSAEGAGGRRRLTMLLAGAGAVLVLGAAAFLVVNRGGGEHGSAAKPPSPSASTRPSLPAGVKCAGSDCTGKDAEAMGCSGSLVSTAKSAAVGATTLEVRYSKTCGTAWGRITGAAPGDQVELSAGKARQRGDITAAGDTIAYTPMVAVKDPAQAEACATLASGQTGCTK
ncbi:hypothetical protein TNCT1_05530 [Streptomyces sp. 1-11]|nr:hypothetical protein TNCT1_05530 [Streptomyces sp. 1-11]